MVKIDDVVVNFDLVRRYDGVYDYKVDLDNVNFCID